MRKEIFGILVVFLVIFTLVSLVSYSPYDPSINNAAGSGEIRNLFGFAGAHVAGLFIGLFGLGAFWIPFLLMLISVNLLSGKATGSSILTTLGGGLLLVVVTGALFAFGGHKITLFEKAFSSGGIVGIPLHHVFTKVANSVGAALIFVVLLIVGLILTTGFSLVGFSKQTLMLIKKTLKQIETAWLKFSERRKKAKKLVVTKKQRPKRPLKKIAIQKKKAPVPVKKVVEPKQRVFDFIDENAGYQIPPISFLQDPEPSAVSASDESLRKQSERLENKLTDFGVQGRISTVTPGPVITTFEYEPAPGVKISKIVNLSDDLSLALRATSIRIATMPGKATIGIEIPNIEREIVRFKDIVSSSAFGRLKSKLPLGLGKDIIGAPVVAALDKMPHLLIAGATGTGKSVGLNAMICSILYKATPEEVKFILIDPKRIELTLYDGIPHLITPVVTDAKKATNALFWAVREMEHRYKLLAALKVRNITQYNNKIEKGIPDDLADSEFTFEKLPYIVIIIDELADLMMVASRDVEVSLMRLAQMARAAGLHLILATQRPSVDVLTGIIKANFPTRLSFQVSSRTDSRTIIDSNGAESLLGNGDMLYMPPGVGRLQRVHGAYISEPEIALVIDHLKTQKRPEYDENVTQSKEATSDEINEDDRDEHYDVALALVTKNQRASVSMVQRHLRIGYNRAARIIEMMEQEGVVGPADGAKPREVLARDYDDIP